MVYNLAIDDPNANSTFACGLLRARNSECSRPIRLPPLWTVTDPHQAGVLGAKVTLTRSDGTEVQTTSADSKGAFRFEGVPSGNYDVQIEHPGFKPSVSRVRVGNQPPRPINVALVLADVRQEVTVGAEATQVSTNASDNLDTVTMDRSALDDLPIFDQDFIGTMSRFLDASSVGTNGVTLIVDGVEGSRAGVSASAIQEVKINQDPYSAEYFETGPWPNRNHNQAGLCALSGPPCGWAYERRPFRSWSEDPLHAPIQHQRGAPIGKVDHTDSQLHRHTWSSSVPVTRPKCAAATTLRRTPRPESQHLAADRIRWRPRGSFPRN